MNKCERIIHDIAIVSLSLFLILYANSKMNAGIVCVIDSLRVVKNGIACVVDDAGDSSISGFSVVLTNLSLDALADVVR